MNEQEIELKLNDYEHEICSLKHRMSDVEAQTKAINNLAISVEKLALSVSYMNDEQKNSIKRLEALESKPAKRWETIITCVITTIVGALLGYLLSRLGIK